MSNVRRYVLITAGLAAAGIPVGAAVAALGMFLGQLASGGVDMALNSLGYGVAAGVGAVAGAIGAPLFGWLILRHVPLGRAIGWTAAGAVLGGAAGMMLPVLRSPVANFLNPVTTAILGAVIGSVAARFYTRARAHTRAPQ